VTEKSRNTVDTEVLLRESFHSNNSIYMWLAGTIVHNCDHPVSVSQDYKE